MDSRKKLGQSNLTVPRMGIGAMVWGQPKGLARWTPAQLAYGPSHGPSDEEQAMNVCLEAGVNLIDTAAMYSNGASEKRVGQLIGNNDVLIATKFPPGMFSRTSDFTKALKDSLARLGGPYVDLYQHHFPSRFVSIPKLMDFMADAVKEGKIKAIGVSNYSAEQMHLAQESLQKHGISLASNQVQYSLLYRKPEVDGVLDACNKLGVTLIAYMPLASGALSGKYGPGRKPKGVFRKFMKPFSKKGIKALVPVVSILTNIGKKYNKTPAQVALRWLIENQIVLPIPGVKNGKQASENIGALSFSLAQEEIEALGEAYISWRDYHVQ